MSTIDAADPTAPADEPGSSGVRSVEVGLSLLPAIAAAPGPLSLTEIAHATGMAAPKAHRYLASLMRAGLVARGGDGGQYVLGPLAVSVGLAALGRLDPERRGREAVHRLAHDLGETALLAVLANRGATVAAVEPAAQSVFMAVRVGSVLSMARSASGRAFLSFHDDPAVRAEAGTELSPAEIDALVAEIRSAGVACVRDTMLAGISAVAAPVYDHEGRVVQVLTVLGSSTAFDATPGGRPARAVRTAAEAVSRALGHSG
ncbi:DNA-binding IclR family transcriptional regulator [Amorphus suaedae]